MANISFRPAEIEAHDSAQGQLQAAMDEAGSQTTVAAHNPHSD